MAFEVPGFEFGCLNAASDLSAKQFTAVVVDSDGELDSPGSDGLMIAGVTQNDPTSGKAVKVMKSGITKMVTNNSAILRGSKVMAKATTGRAALATGTNIVIGTALEANGSNNGALIAVLLDGPSHNALA